MTNVAIFDFIRVHQKLLSEINTDIVTNRFYTLHYWNMLPAPEYITY